MEDFSSGDDIYEAVGGVLEEVAGGEGAEDEIREICQELMKAIQHRWVSSILYIGLGLITTIHGPPSE